MSELSQSNVIRVTVQGVQRTIGVRNINELALFTSEPSNSIALYNICYDAASVGELYGTNSLTYKMAVNVFAQDANPISGRGYLVVIPMSATSATAASFTSDALTLADWKAVNDGSIVVNGVEFTGMDFSNISTLQDVAKILSEKLSNVFVTTSANSLVLTAKKVGVSSTVTLTSPTDGTDLTELLGTGTTVAGTDASGETLVEAISRPTARYTGIITTLSLDDSAISAAASAIQAMDKIWVNSWYSADDITGACATIQAASQTHTRCLVYTQGVEKAKLFEAAYAGRAFSVNFEGSLVSQTMNLKTLANVEPDLGITQNDYNNAETAGVDLYVSYEGFPAVVSNGANSYFDVVYENMAFKFYAQNYMINALKATNTKIPQTEAGVASLTDALAQAFILFVKNGVFAAGKWNSSQTFGDPETFRKNIADQGWYIYHTPVAEQSQAEREQRIAPLIQGAGKRAGAIHEADVLIIVEE